MKLSRSLLLMGVGLMTLSGCDSKKETKSKEQSSSPSFEVSPGKKLLESYYELPHIKEWYTERIQPPAFDYNLDLSAKSYVELVLLRNEIFARNGYLFSDSELRAYFNRFKWYQPLFDIDTFKVQLNEKENAFISKVNRLEDEKLKNKYAMVGGNKLVDANYALNSMQFSTMNDSMRSRLQKMNFALAKADRDQLFYTYDQNQYGWIPNFITTDLYLQLLHKYLSRLMEKAEERALIDVVAELTRSVSDVSFNEIKTSKDPRIIAAAKWANTYISIAYKLIADSVTVVVDPSMKDLFISEVNKVIEAKGQGSQFLKQRIIDYNHFMPRGNYSKSEKLKRYFRAVKWLNTASIKVDEDDQFFASLLIALYIQNNESSARSYEVFSNVVGTFAGEEDGVSVGRIIPILKDNNVSKTSDLLMDGVIDKIKAAILKLKVDRIKPKAASVFAVKEVEDAKIFFSAGRYTPDAEIMIRLVEVMERKRTFPRGLDVFAAFGNKIAESILISDYKEDQKWPAYSDSLDVLKREFKEFSDWNSSIYNQTLSCINSLSVENAEYPLFMKTKYWKKKELTTSLAAWTELKHDMILYSEKPYAAEAGEGGGPPPPIHLSYVEPNVEFWKKSIDLLNYQVAAMKKYDMIDTKYEMTSEKIKEIGNLLLAISNKELNHELITTEEFSSLSWIGGWIESATFRILETDHLPEREKHIGLVADVYAFNSAILEEAVGSAGEIYVVTEINNQVYICKGAVFSYYEFQRDGRLDDENWQKILRDKKNVPDRPAWLNEIYVTTPSLGAARDFGF